MINTKAKVQVDPIIEEIHEIRRQFASRFDYDIQRISEDARHRQLKEGQPVWQPKSPIKAVNPSGGSGVNWYHSDLAAAGSLSALGRIGAEPQ